MSDTPYRKKLVETALPLEAINAACKADKDRSLGTIRNIHKWFAPMPVPALRALIFASLVDDPEDSAERERIFDCIQQLVDSVVEQPSKHTMKLAKDYIRASCGTDLPFVLDPFCGGGSTLVEAQRLGLAARGSDYNPIPVLISRALTELPPLVDGHVPLHGGQELLGGHEWSGISGIAVDVDHYAREIYEAAKRRIGGDYPAGPDGTPVVAWIWARTVESPDPRFQGSHTPLVTSFWLSRKPGEHAFLAPMIEGKTLSFEIRKEGSPQAGSKSSCLFSPSTPITFDYVRDQATHGRMGEMMLALITEGRGPRGYFIADSQQQKAADVPGLESLAELRLPAEALGFRIQGYGMHKWSDLFSARQQLCLTTFAELVSQLPQRILADGGDEEYARAITTILGLCVGKLARLSSKLVGWRTRVGQSKAEPAFGQHVVSMTWDWAEVNPFGASVGDWMQVVETTIRALGCVDSGGPPAIVRQADARTAAAGFDQNCLVITDPPYFSSIGYALLSDYFYIWLRPALKELYPDLFSTIVTPKAAELIAEPARHETKEAAKQYFVEGFTETFKALKAASRADLPMLIVYAYKEQEAERESQVSAGWEAMLEAVIRAGLSIVGTWPIHGTGSTRMRGKKSNALATYVVMVCRPRASTSVRVSRRELVGALRAELGPATQLLQSAAIAPVDLAQAVMGPGMGVFSRYGSVLEPDGTPMTVRSALLLINSVLAEVLDEQEGEFDSDTRWAITWFEQFQYAEAPSGEGDSLARAKVTSIDGLVRSGIIVTRGGTCRLLRRDELPEEYDPSQDTRPTVWESVQHLVKQLLDGGEEQAASLFARLPNSEAARDLAYRLFATCERRGWAEEGMAYNVLVASWPEIARLAQHLNTQQRLGSGQLPGLG
ncbi:MAG: DUF1156 domain-containing protein [Acidimicrobiales bacterium]